MRINVGRWIILYGCVFLLGCTTPQSQSVDPEEELRAVNAAKVPLPLTTPFDSESSRRSTYLKAYEDGCRSGLVLLNVLFNHPKETSDDHVAAAQGWDDGAKAGFGAKLRLGYDDNVLRLSTHGPATTITHDVIRQ